MFELLRLHLLLNAFVRRLPAHGHAMVKSCRSTKRGTPGGNDTWRTIVITDRRSWGS